MKRVVVIRDGIINFNVDDSEIEYPEILMISVNYDTDNNKMYLRYAYSDTPEGLVLINKYLKCSKIKSVLKGSMLYGTSWKSNIHTIKLEDDNYIKVIIVYADEWDNYSKVKQENRLRKIGSDLIEKYNKEN